MPTATIASGRQGASITVRGGHRVQRIVQKAQGLTGAKLAQFMAEILRDELLPVLKSRVPKRTGRMAQSLEIRCRGSAVELRGRWYGALVRHRDTRQRVAEIAMDIFQADQQRYTQLLAAKVRAYLGT